MISLASSPEVAHQGCNAPNGAQAMVSLASPPEVAAHSSAEQVGISHALPTDKSHSSMDISSLSAPDRLDRVENDQIEQDAQISEGVHLCQTCQQYAVDAAQQVSAADAALASVLASSPEFPSLPNAELVLQQYDVLISTLQAHDLAVTQAIEAAERVIGVVSASAAAGSMDE